MGFLTDNQNPTLFVRDKSFPGGSVGELVKPKDSKQFLIWNEEKRIVLSLGVVPGEGGQAYFYRDYSDRTRERNASW